MSLGTRKRRGSDPLGAAPAAVDVPCPYCDRAARRKESSAHLYGGRDFGPVWECEPCRAWVGCHPDGKPLGRLADLPLRKSKMAAHAAFDPLWRAVMRRDECSKKEARNRGYAWLARSMGLAREACHIAMFDIAQCNRVVALCTAVRETARERAIMKEKGIQPGPRQAGMPPLGSHRSPSGTPMGNPLPGNGAEPKAAAA